MHEVAVPSHQRPDTISGKTLRLLADRGVPPERVRVFVVPDQVADYRSAVDPGLLAEVVPGALGLAAQRNLIARWYPEGTQLVQVDDDVVDMRQRTDEKQHTAVADLTAVFDRGFAATAAAGVGLWGLYPVLNPMFMKPRTSVGLYLVLGGLWGCVNTHADHAQLVNDQKEDYERTLRWWRHDGAVVRLDDVAIKTRMYGPGGMQADDQPDRQAINRRAVQWLLAEFPGRVAVAKRRSQVGLEVRLVAPRDGQRVLA